MKPFSKNKRRGYFIFFLLIFFVGAPLFIFDAKGYRLNWTGVLNVFQTGGVYIGTDQSGIDIYVNHVLVRKTSIVQKGIFVQDLKPGTYTITVSKAGLQSWNKTLKVFPEIVTEARTFLIKSNPELIEIPRYLRVQSSTPTTSPRNILTKNPEYDILNAFFAPLTSKTVLMQFGTTSLDSKALGNIFVKNDIGKLRILWMGDPDSVPNYFCENTTCKSQITIKAASKILFFDFFPGRNDLIVLRLENGIYVSEIDDRSTQNIQQIVSGPGFDFRIKDGKSIYLKKEARIYQVSL